MNAWTYKPTDRRADSCPRMLGDCLHYCVQSRARGPLSDPFVLEEVSYFEVHTYDNLFVGLKLQGGVQKKKAGDESVVKAKPSA